MTDQPQAAPAAFAGHLADAIAQVRQPQHFDSPTTPYDKRLLDYAAKARRLATLAEMAGAAAAVDALDALCQRLTRELAAAGTSRDVHHDGYLAGIRHAHAVADDMRTDLLAGRPLPHDSGSGTSAAGQGAVRVRVTDRIYEALDWVVTGLRAPRTQVLRRCERAGLIAHTSSGYHMHTAYQLTEEGLAAWIDRTDRVTLSLTNRAVMAAWIGEAARLPDDPGSDVLLVDAPEGTVVIVLGDTVERTERGFQKVPR